MSEWTGRVSNAGCGPNYPRIDVCCWRYAGPRFEIPLGRDAQRLQAGMPALLVRRAAGILRNVQKERTIEEFDREVAFGFREIRAMDCCGRAVD